MALLMQILSWLDFPYKLCYTCLTQPSGIFRIHRWWQSNKCTWRERKNHMTAVEDRFWPSVIQWLQKEKYVYLKMWIMWGYHSIICRFIRNTYLVIQMNNNNNNKNYIYIYVILVHGSWLTAPNILGISWVIRECFVIIFCLLSLVPQIASEP